MKTLSLIVGPLFLAVVFILGCGDGDHKDTSTCQSESDCPVGYYCDKVCKPDPEGDSDENADQAQQAVLAATELADGNWVFQVDRQWSGEAGFPTDELTEEDYEAIEDGDAFDVVVSNDLDNISIGENPLVGELTTSTDERWEYNITEGAFAGGRFVVWVGDENLQAELTIYGSGVPIVSSERGVLSPEE